MDVILHMARILVRWRSLLLTTAGNNECNLKSDTLYLISDVQKLISIGISIMVYSTYGLTAVAFPNLLIFFFGTCENAWIIMRLRYEIMTFPQ